MVLRLIEKSNIKFYLFQVEIGVEQLWDFTAKHAKFFLLVRFVKMHPEASGRKAV